MKLCNRHKTKMKTFRYSIGSMEYSHQYCEECTTPVMDMVNKHVEKSYGS